MLRVAVTGAGRGIGKATAIRFAKLGADVVLADRDKTSVEAVAAELNAIRAGSALALELDVVALDAGDKLVKAAVEAFGSLDTLVNNAGITRDRAFANMTLENMDLVLEVNLKAPMRLTQAVLRHWKACKDSVELEQRQLWSVVNISSIIGAVVGNFGQGNYAAAKAGLIGFSRAIVPELGRFGARINNVCPGFIETPMTEAVPEDDIKAVVKATPLGRRGLPEEVAEAVTYLAYARFVTGAIHVIDGGYTAL